MCKVTLANGKVLEFSTDEQAQEFKEDVEREGFAEISKVEHIDDEEEEEAPMDSDPTLWCNACGAKSGSQCKCGPIAEND